MTRRKSASRYVESQEKMTVMTIVAISRRTICIIFVCFSFFSSRPALGQAEDPDPHRFDEQIQAFASWDAKNAFPEKPVVFVGSSSIRFWKTGQSFPGVPVVNRGFGGAHISDVNTFISETVLRYRPRMIVFYAGDNDIAAGKDNDQVIEDYLEFLDLVMASDASVDVVYIPIKPSLARWTMWPQMAAANKRILDYSKNYNNLHYVDLASPVLGDDAEPRQEYFIEDGLHLNPSGYDAWTEILSEFFESFQW